MRRALLALGLALSGCGSGASDFVGVYARHDVDLTGCNGFLVLGGDFELRQGSESDLVYLDYLLPGCNLKLQLDSGAAVAAGPLRCGADLGDGSHVTIELESARLELSDDGLELKEIESFSLRRSTGQGSFTCTIRGSQQGHRLTSE